MNYFKNHQLKTNFISFLIIGFIYLISIPQISSKHLQKRLLSKNKSYISNDSITTILNINNELKKSKRKTNYNYGNQNYYYGYGNYYASKNNTDNNTKNKIKGFKGYIGTILLIWFFINFAIGLYLICVMKEFEQTKNKTGDVWFYLYLSNLGILLLSGIKIVSFDNKAVDFSPFGLSSFFFIIMTFRYCIKINREKTINCLSSDKIEEWTRLPSFILVLLGLTDPCCASITFDDTTNEDGHTENNTCIVKICNSCIKVIKRLAYFFSVISFFFGLLFFFLVWIFFKTIYLNIISCIENSNNKKKNKNQKNLEIKQNINQDNNSIDFNSHIILNKKYELGILNKGIIYNIDYTDNKNILNNYDKQTNAERLDVSTNKNEEYEQNYNLPKEEEFSNDMGDNKYTAEFVNYENPIYDQNNNINYNNNNNIPNNYDIPINAGGLEVSEIHKEEKEQSYDLPTEDEVKKYHKENQCNSDEIGNNNNPESKDNNNKDKSNEDLHENENNNNNELKANNNNNPENNDNNNKNKSNEDLRENENNNNNELKVNNNNNPENNDNNNKDKSNEDPHENEINNNELKDNNNNNNSDNINNGNNLNELSNNNNQDNENSQNNDKDKEDAPGPAAQT